MDGGEDGESSQNPDVILIVRFRLVFCLFFLCLPLLIDLLIGCLCLLFEIAVWDGLFCS